MYNRKYSLKYKAMKKILFWIFIFLWLTLGSVFAFSLTDDDIGIIEKYEQKLFILIDDKSNNTTASSVIGTIDYLVNNRELNETQERYLEIIRDDLSYAYYLWEYAGDSSWYVAMTADECYDDEYFDDEDQQCYIKDDIEYNDNTSFIDDRYENAERSEEWNMEILASYAILWNTITLNEWIIEPRHQEVWDSFVRIIPIGARKDFALYAVADDSNWDTAAHVVQNEADNTKWDLTVNLDSLYVDWVFDTSEWLATLIHEFSHVLTLSKQQMQYYPLSDNESLIAKFEENCKTNLLQEWCLYETAYLDDFIDTFWPDPVFTEKVRNQEVNAYNGNEDSFVTEYAATNPWEDIAESFTYFILEPKKSDSSWATKKKNFFYNYKELESLRKQIRIGVEAVRK